MAASDQKQSAKIIVIAIALLSIIIAILVIINIRGRVPENSPSTVGNTGGNLNNGGLFCEADGTIYFSNAYDNGSLYSMNPDQTNLKRIATGNCGNINSGGDYLYYTMSTPESGTGLGFIIKTSGIYRVPKKGGKTYCLTEEETLITNLIGNELYYQGATGSGVGLRKIDIWAKEKSSVVEDSYVLNPACAAGGNIYYGGTTKDHYLYAYNTQSDSTSSIWAGDVWNPVYSEDGYFYYMDISDKYSICRFSPVTATVEVLTHDRADNFNVGYGYVYYTVSVGDTPGLYRIRTDGSGRELVMQGIIRDVNITSTYTYFREYGKDTPMYFVATSGSNYPSIFSAAEDIAKKNAKK